ncbi:MAG: hypothetical protein H7039_14985 [Bryobacteraceae bacterium]|nr:hypothetical protein [Bryobacteraceae bacterium]
MSSANDPSPGPTDWTVYYQSVPWTAHLTRSYTRGVLLRVLARYCDKCESIIEFGGANSCFLDSILRSVKPRLYSVVDTNQFGLELLISHPGYGHIVSLHNDSIFDFIPSNPADCAFSVGLVEHFDVNLTRRAVEAHFNAVRPGGLVVITFPTPTFLYRSIRGLLESAGLWKFPDERPLLPAEVIAAIGERGEIVEQRTLWPLLLTQHLVVSRRIK